MMPLQPEKNRAIPTQVRLRRTCQGLRQTQQQIRFNMLIFNYIR